MCCALSHMRGLLILSDIRICKSHFISYLTKFIYKNPFEGIAHEYILCIWYDKHIFVCIRIFHSEFLVNDKPETLDFVWFEWKLFRFVKHMICFTENCTILYISNGHLSKLSLP